MQPVRWTLAALAALSFLIVGAPAFAQPITAKAVSVCGTPGNTPVAGNSYPVTQDLTGTLCTSGTGGGGGAVTVADGADVTQGTTTDSACATDNGTCTAEALLKRNNQRLTTLNTTLGTPIQATGGTVQTVAGSTGGSTPISKIVANNTTSVAICTAACTLYSVAFTNNSATIAYVKLYNASQGSTTCGSGTPVDRILIPASASGAGVVIPVGGSVGVAYGTALTACTTTGQADNDTGSPAATTYLESFYIKQ
jgi:hypothetical protein